MSHFPLIQKPIGRSGLSTSSLAIGCTTFGREIDEKDSFRILDYAIENGINFFDTAESYGGGNSKAYRKEKHRIDDIRETTDEMHSSEKIIGRWLKHRRCREKILLCTKVSSGASPENIIRQHAASCQRLGVDFVDIYLLHKPSPEVPIAESMHALTELVRKGLVRIIGVSNFNAAQIAEILEVCKIRGFERIEIIQPCYNLVYRIDEIELFPLCRHEQIAITSYSPLAAGFLSGKYTPDRKAIPHGSRFHIVPDHADIYFNDENFSILEKLKKKAGQLNIPIVQLALFWAMTNPDITACLIGARSIDNVKNAILAAQMPPNPKLRNEMSAW